MSATGWLAAIGDIRRYFHGGYRKAKGPALPRCLSESMSPDPRVFGRTRERFNRTGKSVCILAHPFLICVKILTMGRPLSFGQRKDFNTDKIRDERGCTPMLTGHVPIRGNTPRIRIALGFLQDDSGQTLGGTGYTIQGTVEKVGNRAWDACSNRERNIIGIDIVRFLRFGFMMNESPKVVERLFQRYPRNAHQYRAIDYIEYSRCSNLVRNSGRCPPASSEVPIERGGSARDIQNDPLPTGAGLRRLAQSCVISAWPSSSPAPPGLSL
jgi:hypothetical protein